MPSIKTLNCISGFMAIRPGGSHPKICTRYWLGVPKTPLIMDIEFRDIWSYEDMGTEDTLFLWSPPPPLYVAHMENWCCVKSKTLEDLIRECSRMKKIQHLQYESLKTQLYITTCFRYCFFVVQDQVIPLTARSLQYGL